MPTEKRLIYISTCDSDVDLSDIESIMKTAMERNGRENITGTLLYNGLNFLQVLEGEAPKVDALYADIVADQRHHGVTTVLEEEIDSRAFPKWSMNLAVMTSKAGPLPDWATVGSAEDLKVDEISPGHIQAIIRSFDTLKG